jgi:hypothetical protein
MENVEKVGPVSGRDSECRRLTRPARGSEIQQQLETWLVTTDPVTETDEFFVRTHCGTSAASVGA